MAGSLLDRVVNTVRRFQRTSSGEIGGSGTRVWDGTIVDEEYKSKLDTEFGQGGLTIFNRMRRSDPVVRASLKAVELKLRQGKWYIEPPKGASNDDEITEFVKAALFDYPSNPWAERIRLILTMLPFGFSVFEKVFIEREGKIVWDKWAFRSQSSIVKFQLGDGKPGIVQSLSGDAIGKGGTDPEIPIEKLLIFAHEKEGDNWRGVSLLRSAYKPWFFKEALEKIEAIAYERQGVGIPKSIMPVNAKPDDVSKIESLLKNLRANEKSFLLLPNGFDAEMLDMHGSQTKDPSEAIKRKNWEIAINVLAPHIVLGQETAGSYALADKLSTNFDSAVQAYGEEICDVISSHAIKQLVDINFGEQKEYPKLRVTGIRETDIKVFSEGLKNLIDSGVVNTDEGDEMFAREIAGLPEKTKEEIIESREEAEEKKIEEQKQFLKQEEAKATINAKINSKVSAKDKDKTTAKVGDKTKKKEVIEASEAPDNNLKPYWRKLTAAEGRIDLGKIERAMDDMEAKFGISIGKLLEEEKKSLIEFAEQIISLGDPSLMANYASKYKDEIADEIYKLYLQAFERGKILASNELDIQAPITKSIYENAARARSMAIADKMVNDLVSEVSFNLTDLMEKGTAKGVLTASLKEIVATKVAVLISRASSNSMVGAINTGRFSVFDSRPEVIHSLQRSEILDTRTCNYCLSVDGRSVYPGDDIAEIEQFHHMCRGIWVAISRTEVDKPEVTGVPKDLKERVGTLSEFKQMDKPNPLENSLADDFIKGGK